MTKNNLSCDVVQDLLPSYVEKLTSPVTNQAVQHHLEDCPYCREILARMQAPTKTLAIDEKKEIDYMKKAKTSTKKWVLVTIVTIFLAILFHGFLIGKTTYPRDVNIDVVTVKDRTLYISGRLIDSTKGGTKLLFSDDSMGNIDISMRSVWQSPLNKNTFISGHTSYKRISQVSFRGEIIWSGGEPIDEKTSRVFKARHPYIGNMSANANLASELGLAEDLGAFTNELYTGEEPYGWKLIMKKDYSKKNQGILEKKMKAYATLLLANISNLDHVIFDYTLEGKKQTLTWTEKDASKALEKPLKELAQTPHGLQTLLRKVELLPGLSE